jgi:MFS family permease
MMPTIDAGAGIGQAPAVAARPYYGWIVLGVAALAMVGTLPGRTQGLGLVTESLMRDMGLTRVGFAQVNLMATLIGALFCAGVGRLVDRRGSRIVLTATALLLGSAVLAMSRATSVTALVVLITLSRGLGQSTLSIVSLAMVGKWFRRRLSLAMAVYAVAMSVGFMAAFPLVGALVLERGWRAAWAAIGVALVAGLAPIAWGLDRSSPEAIGLRVDGEARGDAAPGAGGADEALAFTLAEALRSPAFWVVACASSLYGLVASGIGLFNESILAERGFTPDVYHTALAVTAITGLAGNFAAGAFADRGSMRSVLVTALLLLTIALAALAHVSTLAHVMAQAVLMGLAGGFVMVVFFGFWARAYGRPHLGRIQGAAQAMTVVASAVGPLWVAWCVDVTGSYAVGFYVLAATVLVVAGAATVVPLPQGAVAAADER